MAPMVGCSRVRSQELHLSLPHGFRDPALESSSTAISGYRQGVGLEVKHMGLKLVPIWDVGTTVPTKTQH